MKKELFAIVISLLVLIVSCSSDPKTGSSVGMASVGHKDAIAAIGDVNKVFSASSTKTITLYPADGSKFCTGQNLDYNGFKVVFEANLVEYNSLDPEIVEYVESLEKNNAMMHQSYPEFESGSINPDKTYVELATYTIIETQEVLLHEVRVFYGDYMDTYSSSYWYAKSVTFSPDMTIDVDAGIDVYTGERVEYRIPFNNGNGSSFNGQASVLKMKEVEPLPEFSALGEVKKAYAWFDGNEIDKIHMFGGDDTLAECYLVELNSLNPDVAEKFNKSTIDGLHQRGWNVESEEGKSYVEVCFYKDGSTGDVKWMGYRLRTTKIPGSQYGYNTVTIQSLD